MDYRAEYQKKLTAAADAVKVVKSGDWVDYGFCANHPVALDKALADRMSADAGLTGINFRGGIALWQPEVTKIPDVETRITWNSWHTSGIERKLVDKGKTGWEAKIEDSLESLMEPSIHSRKQQLGWE